MSDNEIEAIYQDSRNNQLSISETVVHMVRIGVTPVDYSRWVTNRITLNALVHHSLLRYTG